jgi:coenzyme PQQ precursor peptide PqqA
MNTLNRKAFRGLLFLLLVMAALLFIPAGTLDYWQAWTFLAVYFASSLAITLYLIKNDPKLLERRMSAGPTAEKEPTQKIIMLFASLGFIGLILFPALDHRFAWSHVPPYAALAGDVLGNGLRLVRGWKLLPGSAPVNSRRLNMAWTTPVTTEVCVGMEVTSYASAEI